jgi:hypothetical protein
VIVLDHDDVWMAIEHRAKFPHASFVERRAGRILSAWRHDERSRAGAKRAVEILGARPRIVDPDRLGDETERRHEIEDAGEPGILDRDVVAGSEMRLEDALDPVEAARDDRDVARDAVCRESAAR